MISLLVWIINSWLNDRKEVENKKQTMNIEKEALIKFYHAANGEEWTNNANWCGIGAKDPTNMSKYKNKNSHMEVDTHDIQTWKGITCNPRGKVTKLILSGNNLKGTYYIRYILDIY